jgi:hypothetical protein
MLATVPYHAASYAPAPAAAAPVQSAAPARRVIEVRRRRDDDDDNIEEDDVQLVRIVEPMKQLSLDDVKKNKKKT